MKFKLSGVGALLLALVLIGCTNPDSPEVDTTTYSLYVTNYGTSDGTDGLSAFSIGAGGALTAIDTYATGDSPFGVAVSTDGRYLYKTNVYGGENALAVYSIGAGGVLTAGATYTTGGSPKGFAVSPDSSHLYVTNSGSNGPNGLSAFSIGIGGALTAITSGTLTTGAMPIGIAISPQRQLPLRGIQQQSRLYGRALSIHHCRGWHPGANRFRYPHHRKQTVWDRDQPRRPLSLRDRR